MRELPGDLRGGVSSAVVALGVLLPLGLLAFASLGPDGGSLGVRAAFVAAIVGGAVATAVGGSVIPGSGPRISTTLIFAGFVAALAADPRLRGANGLDVESILILASLCVALAGALQIAFALMRLGSITSFVPLPVVAGFMDGVAVLTIAAQIPILFGPSAYSWTRDSLDNLQLTGLAVGLASAAVAWVVARRMPRAPWALVGLAFGTALSWAIAAFGGSAIPLLGAPASGLQSPLLALFRLEPNVTAIVSTHLPQLLTTAFVIALVASLDGLLSAAGVDVRLHTRHEPNRVLLGQGLANVASAAFGGLPVVHSLIIPLASYRAGSRTRASGIVAAFVLLLVMIVGSPIIGIVPAAATAGVMIIVGLGLFDQWSRTVWRELREGSLDRDALWSLATVLIVCVVTVFFGFLVGIIVGVALSVILFVASVNRSLVRSVATGETRGSRRIYPPDQASLLRARGAEIRLVEIEGAIFFGTAHKFEREMEAAAKGTRFLILDLRRVTMIDASGALAFDRIASRARSQGTQLVLAALVAGDRHARALRAHGAFARAEDRHWYPDADRALEYAERHLLDEAGQRPPSDELPLEKLSLFDGIGPLQREKLRAYLSRMELAAHEVLFRRGEPGDCLYLLAKGSVSILANIDDGVASAHRLASFAPGVIFGETAMLDGGGRTASGVADEPSVAYVLTRAALDAISAEERELATVVLLNIARQISARLRFATATIQAAER